MKGDGERNRRRLIVGGWLGPFFRIIDSRRVRGGVGLLSSSIARDLFRRDRGAGFHRRGDE